MNNKVTNKQVLKYFFKQIFKLKYIFYLTFISIIIVSILGLVAPIFFKEIIDVISNTNLDKDTKMIEITNIFYFFVLNVFTMFIFWKIIDYFAFYSYVKIDYNLSLKCFKYLHKHSYNFFINNFAGSINKKIARLIGAIQGLYDILIWDFTRFSVSLIFIVIVLSTQNFYLGLGFFLRILFFIIISIFLNKYKIPYVKDAADENSKVGGIYADTIINNFNISIFGTLLKEYNYINKALNIWFRKEKKLIKVNFIIFTILSIISVIGEIGLLYFSIHLWYNGSITVGTFVLVLTYQIILSQQIFSISHILGRISTNIGNAMEMIEILNTPHEIIDTKNAKNLIIPNGQIEFKDVTFSYNKNEKVFDNLSFKIKPGEKVAIVGTSGSGKTSLIRLLFRFYDIKGGQILIDGQDISKVTQDSLRSNISLVPQEPILFHRSLKENICYGNQDFSENEFLKISKLAHCHEFISGLKDGYDTLVGERGVKLSGGERQRVAIARAMIASNKILVLDEATSSLDSESEKLIQDALEKLIGNKTIIVIAHRLSTIMKMDRILVFEKGKIIEEGSHKELLKKSGTYKKLWDIQSGGFL